MTPWTGSEYAEGESQPDHFFLDLAAVERLRDESAAKIRHDLGQRWLDVQFPQEELTPKDLFFLFTMAYELRLAADTPGFASFVQRLRTRAPHPAIAELRAVRHSRRHGRHVEFVEESTVAGQSSFDGRVTIDGHDVAVEVKAREPRPLDAYAGNKIQTSLGTARRQLPSNRPGIVYLQVSGPWAHDIDTLKEIDAECRRFLASTGRVNCVVLIAEISRLNSTGTRRSFSVPVRPIVNHNPRFPLPSIRDDSL
jgi:hypothetical protein